MSDRPPLSQLPLAFEARRSTSRPDFVPGACNEAALAYIDAWPHWPSQVCALWGPSGSGKTHLSHIWLADSQALELDPGHLSMERISELEPGAAILIDDADRVEGGAGLFHLINFVNQTRGWLLMTGLEAPPRWPTCVPDLHSRLTAVPGVALEAPDEALIARVLLKLFAERHGYVTRMAEIKTDPHEAHDPARIATILSKQRKRAEELGMDEDQAELIWKTLIDWNVNYEKGIIAARRHAK